MAIQIQKFRRHERGTLQGFVTILMMTIGLEIRDATVHQKNGESWISLLSKVYQGANGEQKFSYIIKFLEKKRWAKFQAEALAALDQYLSHHDQSAPEIPDDDIPI